MAVVRELPGDRIVVAAQYHTSVVRSESRVRQTRVMRTGPTEFIDETEDPGDLTLLFDNKLI